jgi:hypothetical protein
LSNFPWLSDVLLKTLTLTVMLVGLFGLAVPIVPGLVIMWLGALGYGLFAGFGVLGWIMFALITILMIAGARDRRTMVVGADRARGKHCRKLCPANRRRDSRRAAGAISRRMAAPKELARGPDRHERYGARMRMGFRNPVYNGLVHDRLLADLGIPLKSFSNPIFKSQRRNYATDCVRHH